MKKINSETLYELINDGTIKANTKMRVYKDDVYITTITFDGYDFIWETGTFSSGMLFNPLCDFEIIEDKPYMGMMTKDFVAKTDTQDVKFDLLLMFGNDYKIFTIDTYNKTVVEKTKESK